MGHVIGIDLGTTNSCVATFENGQPVVLANAEGDRTTPSVISFLLEEDERLVGQAARRQAVIHPDRTITSIKRFMGRRVSEVPTEAKIVPYEVVSGDNDAARVRVGDRDYSPEELSAMILGKLKADAEAYLGKEVTEAVITVPAYFNDAQRKATKDAAEIAGLKVLRLVNEPTAAALAYGFTQGREEQVLVFDLGGGTFDVSVLEIGESVFEVMATKGDNHLGGDDFDKAIVDWLVASFREEKGADLSLQPEALQRLYEAAEKAKIELSSLPKTTISLPFIYAGPEGPEHLEKTLTRAELAELCHGLLERLVGPTQEAIEAAGLEASDIDHVLLVGGMTRMPAVQEKVQEMIGTEPHKGVHPDEAVALGAAIQAGVLAGEVDDVLLLDVTPLSLGIETKGGVMTKLIEANTTIPARTSEVFTTAEDNQPSVEVHVLQGEREMAADNRSLGRVQLMGIPPAMAGIPQIEVTFDIDADGILTVTARDLGTGDVKETRIEATTGLSDEEVERMHAEAAAHQSTDAQARQAIDARNSAEAARDQARKLLADSPEQISEQERERIERGVNEIEALLEAEADVADLEEARDDLLRLLQGVAERIYGKSMEIDDTPSVGWTSAVDRDSEDDVELDLDVEEVVAEEVGPEEMRENG